MAKTDKSLPSEAKLRKWMRAEVFGRHEHIDRKTDEVDATGLGEAAAYEFDLVESNGYIPEIVFDVAVEIADEYDDDADRRAN